MSSECDGDKAAWDLRDALCDEMKAFETARIKAACVVLTEDELKLLQDHCGAPAEEGKFRWLVLGMPVLIDKGNHLVNPDNGHIIPSVRRGRPIV